MEFEREFIQATLGGINLYGFILAAIFLLGAAWTTYREINNGEDRSKALRNLGITAIVAVAAAVAWFIAAPEERQEVQIRYYGIIIVTAMLVATTVGAWIARRTGRDPEHIYGALTWAIIPGIIGARLWFVFFPPISQIDAGFDRAYYLENFFDLNNGAIAIWSGGLSIFGAVLGGLLGTYIYLRRNKLPYWPWLDIAAIVLPLGQAIGRWANFVNRELYGVPTGVSWWGLDIPIEERPDPYAAIEYFDAKFHPLFLYESLWSLAAFFILLYLYNRRRDMMRAGDFFLLYIAQYSLIRFLLEFIRIEVTLVGDVNLSQVVTLAAFILSVGYYFIRRRAADGEEGEGYPEPLPQERPPQSGASVRKEAPEPA